MDVDKHFYRNTLHYLARSLACQHPSPLNKVSILIKGTEAATVSLTIKKKKKMHVNLLYYFMLLCRIIERMETFILHYKMKKKDTPIIMIYDNAARHYC